MALPFAQWVDLMRFERLDNFQHEVWTIGWKFTDNSAEAWTARFCAFKDKNPVAVRAAAAVLPVAVSRSIQFNTKGVVVGAISSRKTALEPADPVAVLGSAVAKQLGWPWMPALISKKVHKPLHGIYNSSERDAEVANAYTAMKLPPSVGYVLIVDDFVTRGSTLDDAARAVAVAAGHPITFGGLALAKTERVNWAGNVGISNSHVPERLAVQWDAVQ